MTDLRVHGDIDKPYGHEVRHFQRILCGTHDYLRVRVHILDTQRFLDFHNHKENGVVLIDLV